MRGINKTFSSIVIGTLFVFGIVLLWLYNGTNVNTVSVINYDAIPYAEVILDYNF